MDFLHALIFCASFSCNSMPCSGYSTLHGVNHNQKKTSRDMHYDLPHIFHNANAVFFHHVFKKSLVIQNILVYVFC